MDELLAKPDVLLFEHLQKVVEYGQELAERLKLPEALRARALLACALHDVGKATQSFQQYIRKQRGRAYPHALASLPIALVAELQGLGRPPIATAAVVSHHSPLGPEVYRGWKRPEYHPDLKTCLEALWRFLSQQGVMLSSSVEDCLTLLEESPSDLLEQTFSFHGENRSLRGILQQLPPRDFADVKTVLHLADWLASSGQQSPPSLFLNAGCRSIETYMQRKNFHLHSFQQRVVRKREQALRLRAPTGTGKTEALLLWAGDAERLLYLLPTQATVNAMWCRLRRIYGEENVGLAHGLASYILRKEFEEEALDLRLFASVFAKPVVVATLDQYLLAHLHGRHWEERLALSRRATMVLDEIHSYEPYTLGLLQEALRRDPPARLALASATLPDPLLELFEPGTLEEAEEELWKRYRHRVLLRKGRLKDALDDIISYAEKGKRVLVIANTVNEAQTIYQCIQERNWNRRCLLHSRFTFRDRQQKEAHLEQPEAGTILVATQVVEVSLDISYDVLFSEVAPVDALVQRMGRVNRYGEQSPVPVFVFEEWSSGAERVYGRDLLAISRDLLADMSEIPTDRDLAKATEKLYEEIIPSSSYQRELEEGQHTLEEVQQILGCYTIDLSDEEMRARFTTRKGHLSVDVLPEAFQDEAFTLVEQGQRWRLVELLVPVPIYWIVVHAEWFSPSADLHCYTTALPYDTEVGLAAPGQEEAPASVHIW